MTTKAPYSWRVFTAELLSPTLNEWGVISTLWTSDGAQADGRNVVLHELDQATAERMAALTQQEYDSVRRAFEGSDG